MKKSKFTEEQIIEILAQRNAGKSVEELCRQHKVSDATFYKWQKKYGSMNTAEAKRLKELELENARMKKLIANLSLDNLILKEALGKK